MKEIVVEPRPGGRWFTVCQDGSDGPPSLSGPQGARRGVSCAWRAAGDRPLRRSSRGLDGGVLVARRGRRVRARGSLRGERRRGEGDDQGLERDPPRRLIDSPPSGGPELWMKQLGQPL